MATRACGDGAPRRRCVERGGAGNRHRRDRSRRSRAAPPAPRPPSARTPTPCPPTGRPAPRRASARCRRVGFRPDDVAEGRRHAAGPGGVGAQRERHDPGRHRARRAGRRSARHAQLDRTRCAACRTGSACPPGRWRTGRGWSCPAASRRHPAGAARPARWCRRYRRTPGQAAVVGRPATSMLSFTANGTPQSGRPLALRPAACAPAPARSSSGRRVIQIAGSSCARSAASAASAASTGVICNRGLSSQGSPSP